MTTIDKKAELLLDAVFYAKDHSDEAWASDFLASYNENEPVWKAIEGFVEGYVESFTYVAIKRIYSLWNGLCESLNVLPDLDYSDIDFVEDIIDNWEQYRT